MVLCYFDPDDDGSVDDGICLKVYLPSFKEEIGSRIIQSFIKWRSCKIKITSCTVLIKFPFLRLLPSMSNIPPIGS